MEYPTKVIILGIIVGIIVSIPATYFAVKSAKDTENRRCQSYCNCSITNDCNFTFDFDEVKDCKCE